MMRKILFIARRYIAVLFCSITVFWPLTAYAQTEINPAYFYLVKGQLTGGRGLQVGDPVNWTVQINNREGQSAGGKVFVKPASYKEKDDALQLTWAPRKTDMASATIFGAPLDFSKLKHQAALTIDMRVDVKPDKDVKIGLSCGYPCGASISVNKLISAFPRGEWFSLPLPLNCFKGDDVDLSKITSPFTMSTEGKFTVTITNIRLEKLGADEKGCATDIAQ